MQFLLSIISCYIKSWPTWPTRFFRLKTTIYENFLVTKFLALLRFWLKKATGPTGPTFMYQGKFDPVALQPLFPLYQLYHL